MPVRRPAPDPINHRTTGDASSYSTTREAHRKQHTTTSSHLPSPRVMDSSNNNKRERESRRDNEELPLQVKRPRIEIPTEQGTTTLRSVDEIVFETVNNVGDVSQGSFAAFFEPNPQVTIADGSRLPIAGDAPVRFHYSWDRFKECMRGRLGSRTNGSTSFCCAFTCASETARPLLRYKYHFGGQVGFGSLVQLFEARLVGCRLPVARGVLDEVTVSVRFSSSDMLLSGDYLARAEAGIDKSPDDDHMDVAE
ncbi:unnamed protein product [Fusarium graminearum]|nr:unnamed protein product [Fusarium graminearum]